MKCKVTVIVAVIVLFNRFECQDLDIDDIFISNLNSKCMRCLCEASSNCDTTIGCDGDFCGPYQISHAYYLDAVKNTSFSTNIEAYQNCAVELPCAQLVVKYYISQFARDCNGDGVTDCTDYAMINFNGGYSCEKSLFQNVHGRRYAERYLNCVN